MEAALDLSASRSSTTPVRIKTEFNTDLSSISMNKTNRSRVSPTSSNQSPTSSTMMSNSVFPQNFFRSLIPTVPFGGLQQHLTPPMSSPFSANVTSIFENPALALASALASQGFLSPASAPPYPNFFNVTTTTAPSSNSPGESSSPCGGSSATPPASTTANSFFGNGRTSTPEPVSFLPSASLALSTLHRRRRPTAYRRQQSQQPSQLQSPTDQKQSNDQSMPDSGEQPPPMKKSNGEVSSDKKDELYWERRRKNNEAAKRSRDARRAKEEEIVVRAAYLEQENLKLKAQVAVLKNETAKLHFMLLNHVNPSA